MSLSTKWIIVAMVLVLVLLVFSPFQAMRIVYGAILLLVIVYFLELVTGEFHKNKELVKTVNKLKNTCEELDENTKLIVKTDLELTKTQEELD